MVMADTPPAWSIDWWSWLLTSSEVERQPLRGILGDNVLEVAAQSSSVTRATYPLDGSKALTVSIRHFCRMFAANDADTHGLYASGSMMGCHAMTGYASG